MRQYDVVRLTGGEIVVLLQSDLLDAMSTRVVVPLVALKQVEPTPRLHPKFRLGRREFVVAMEQITSVRAADVGKVLGSAQRIDYEIKRAFDMVLSGV